MAERAVKLVIQVDDKDVAKAEQSLNRMGQAAQNVNKVPLNDLSRQRIKGNEDYFFGKTSPLTSKTQQANLLAFMGKDMPQAATKAEEAIAAVETVAGTATAQAGGFAAAMGPVGAALLTAAAAAVIFIAAGVTLAHVALDLTKGYASYVLEIDKVAEANGLAVETVGALRHEAEAQGRSWGNVESGVAAFRKTIGEAAAGAETARGKLKLLGIDGSKAIYDVDGAFKQAIASIVTAPTVIEQSRRAFAAFGDEGYKLLPFLREFGGDVEKAIRKAEELGIQVSGKNVAAAREFNRAYEDTKKVIDSVAYAFGSTLLPIVRDALRDLSQWLTAHRADVKAWADSTGNFVRGVIGAFKEIIAFVDAHPILSRILLGVATSGGSEVVRQGIVGTANIPGSQQPRTTPLPGQYTTDYSRPGSAPPDLAALKAVREEQQRQREEAIKRNQADFEAAITISKNYAEFTSKQLSDWYGKLKDNLSETGNIDEFKRQVEAVIDWYIPKIAEADERIKSLENVKAGRVQGGLTPNQRVLLDQEQELRNKGFADRYLKVQEDAEKQVLSVKKRRLADQLREAEEAMRKQFELFDQRDQYDIENRRYALQTLQITEQQYLDFADKIVLDSIERRRDAMKKFLDEHVLDGKKRAAIEGEIAKLNEEITQQKLRNERSLTAEAEARLEIVRQIRRLETENADPSRVAGRRKDLANREELDLKREVTGLNDALANGGINDALKIQAAHLRDILELRDRELNAVIRINRAQLELSRAMEISNKQIRAGVYEHMAAQKTLNEGIVDGINGTYDAILRRMNEPLDKLNEKSKGLLSFITEPLKAMRANWLSGVFGGIVDKIFPDGPMKDALKSTGNPVLDEAKKQTTILEDIRNNTGGRAGFNPTTGGGLGGFLQRRLGLGGGGNGPGGTPFFNPTRGGGQSNRGVPGGKGMTMEELEGDLVQGGGPQKGGWMSKLGGASGIAGLAMMAGSMIGGKWGGVLSKAGMGAQIGSMFAPGIGTAIGAGVGALIGLFSGGGGGDAMKKLKEAAASQFGINVKDKGVLNQLKALGEGMFGKGKVGPNAVAVVRSEEGQNILRAYAEASGQSSKQIDRLNYGDPNWEGNQFRSHFSGFGAGAGSGPGVGTFTPHINGSIMPATPNVTVSSGASSGVDRQLVASLAEAIFELKDQVAAFKTMPAGALVKAGLDENPEAAADAVESEYENYGRRSETLARLTGNQY